MKNFDLEKYKFEFQENQIKYIQIYNKIKKMINNGIIKENEALASIRKLSDILNVNKDTVIKAYNLLESELYIYSIKGKGNFARSNQLKSKKIDLKDQDFYRLDTGNPSSEIFPSKNFAKAVHMALDESTENIFAYDEDLGIEELKEKMKEYLSISSSYNNDDELVIVSGAQQGIDVIAKGLINYKDNVIIESPTYSGAIDILNNRNANIISVPMLDDGIDIGVLKQKIKKNKPKLLYIMTNFQNPTGISYSDYKKKKLLELAREYDFYILEDDFISDFKFDMDSISTLKSMDVDSRVIYIKSFSKILMPGIRIGLMSIPKDIYEMRLVSKSLHDISTSTLIQKSLFYYFDRFNWKEHLKCIDKLYSNKYRQVKKYLNDKNKGYFEIQENLGGINFLLKIKEGYSSKEFVDILRNNNVFVRDGSIFYDKQNKDQFFRINIAHEDIERLRLAIDIIFDCADKFYMGVDK